MSCSNGVQHAVDHCAGGTVLNMHFSSQCNAFYLVKLFFLSMFYVIIAIMYGFVCLYFSYNLETELSYMFFVLWDCLRCRNFVANEMLMKLLLLFFLCAEVYVFLVYFYNIIVSLEIACSPSSAYLLCEKLMFLLAVVASNSVCLPVHSSCFYFVPSLASM